MSLHIIFKSFRDHWKSTVAWTLGLMVIIAIELYIYPTIVESSDAMKEYIEAFPESFRTIFRMENYFSGSGFLGTELFSLMIPLIFVSVGAARGSSAIAGEEETGTADILFSLPISRTKIALSKFVAVIIEYFILSSGTVVIIAIGSEMVDMDVSIKSVIIAIIAASLLGLIFSALALLAGSFTGKKGSATGLAITVAIAALLFYSLAPLVDTFDSLTPFNPVDWAVNGNPLSEGVPGINFIKLTSAVVLIIAVTLFLFRKRDIKV